MDEPDLTRLQRLMTLATGDAKHAPSAISTLPALWALYSRVLRIDPAQPRAEDRDRFVLSKGHGPLALYAVLADRGFFPASHLPTFAQPGSILGTHPDRLLVPGVEVSTGSLGHGLAMAIGMALGLQIKRSPRRVIVLLGDGECNEGSVWESVLLAGSRSLPNLTAVVINNHSSSLELGDLAAKFAVFGWAARTVDGRDPGRIAAAVLGPEAHRPTAVIAELGETRE